MDIPKSHPRYSSLRQRHVLLEGLKRGIVTEAGLIAHGRGEAYDYLLGEKTTRYAKRAEKTAVAMLLLAKKPVISINGNVAALVPGEAVRLAGVLKAKLEVNLFYKKEGREERIAELLKEHGAREIYGVVKMHRIGGLESDRAWVDDAIWQSDIVLVSLEDGDRTEALRRMGKRVIAVDLNPLSRTAQKADITIVDNVIRAFPNMIKIAKELRRKTPDKLEGILEGFDNRRNLKAVEGFIRSK